jgi:Uma2 family endonuclease
MMHESIEGSSQTGRDSDVQPGDVYAVTMSHMPKRPATYQDLLSYPEGTSVELISGELRVLPRPAAQHTRGSSRLGYSLEGPFGLGRGGPGGWVILDEPELHLSGDALIPDLAGWRRERMPEIPDVAAFELAPDWVCEFLSRDSTAAYDRSIKMPVYAAKGVKHLWLADPRDRTLEIYRLVENGWLSVKTFSGDALIRAEPFDAVELELGLLWAR